MFIKFRIIVNDKSESRSGKKFGAWKGSLQKGIKVRRKVSVNREIWNDFLANTFFGLYLYLKANLLNISREVQKTFWSSPRFPRLKLKKVPLQR